jgi:hypothetical protein
MGVGGYSCGGTTGLARGAPLFFGEAAMTLILNNDEIDQMLDMKLCLNILENLYREYGDGRTVDIPRCDAVVPSKLPDHVYGLKTMSGCVPYCGKAAIRLNSDTIPAITRPLMEFRGE